MKTKKERYEPAYTVLIALFSELNQKVNKCASLAKVSGSNVKQINIFLSSLVLTGNFKGGSITALLTSCLTDLD